MLQNLYFKTIILFLLIFNAYSEDFGKHGNTFKIEEYDLLEYINKTINKIDIDKFQKEFIEESKKSINRPKPTIIPYAKTSKVYYYDPSITLQNDYKDNRGVIFAKKGTKINPLDKVNLTKDLIFIDGDNENQLNFAIEYYNKKDKKTKIILTNGAVIDLMKSKNIRFYFDQNGILTKKFSIKNIPAVVSQENKLLKIQEVVLSYD